MVFGNVSCRKLYSSDLENENYLVEARDLYPATSRKTLARDVSQGVGGDEWLLD
jgi:hypothetical protein